jgi:hypothetical protein
MPMKKQTDLQRRERRQQAQAEGMLLLQQGSVEEAIKLLEKSLDVTTEIAYSVIRVLKDRDIECMVAPYEADAQLAYLAKEGYVQAVISEDSDLIVYHCGTLLAKLDSGGNCDVLHVRDLPAVPLFKSLTYEAFVIGCILSGCDYLGSLPKVGVKTAFKLASTAKCVPSLMSRISVEFGIAQRDLEPYESELRKAFYCFAHHLVFDPWKQTVVNFTNIADSTQCDEGLVGRKWQNDIATKVCLECVLDPTTHQAYLDTHGECVGLYFKKVKKNQKSLSDFVAFDGMRPAKVLTPLAVQPVPVAKKPVTGFVGSGITVRSKYFAEAWCPSSSDDDGESGLSPEDRESQRNSYPDPDSEGAPLACVSPSLVVAGSSGACPHKNPQCGQFHSSFTKCRGAASPMEASPSSSQQSQAGLRKRLRGEPVAQRSERLEPASLEVLRELPLSAPPPTVASDASDPTNHTLKALELMNSLRRRVRISPQETPLTTEDQPQCLRTTASASQLFAKFSFQKKL